MAQDPAFLLYYKDILVSCADWDADELGWYLRLMCHQADKQGGLINSMEDLASLAGVKYSQYPRFLQVWENRIKHKFELTETGLLLNIKQSKVLEERRKFKEDQGEKGLFGYYIKIAKREILALNMAWETLEPAIRKYLHENISTTQDKELNQANWKQTLENIKANPLSWATSPKGDAIGNGDADAIGNGIKEKGGAGGKGFNTMPVASDFNGLPDQYYGMSIERLKLQKGVDITHETITSMWEIFKVQKLTGEEYHANKGRVYSYFLDWLKNQNFNNGTTQTRTTTPNKSTIASKHEAGIATAIERGKQKFAAAGK